MADESRLERWQRTGALHVAVALVVAATWVYFQVSYPAAERPIVLNEVLLLALGWMGTKFFVSRTKGDAPAGEGKPELAPAEAPPAIEPAPEPAPDDSGGRHRAR